MFFMNRVNRDQRVVAIIGAGMVGMSCAYALLNQGICNRILLIDVDEQRAMGEAMDLNHGLPFAPRRIQIESGSYRDLKQADIAVLCAGVNQKPGESRLSLLQRNTVIARQVTRQAVDAGFSGLFLVASNPVDIMTWVVLNESGFPPSRVFGSGTTLDSARLRCLLGEYFSVDPRNVHAYVIGEHGDSEFVPWSQALLATRPILSLCEERGEACRTALNRIREQVRDSAQVIIRAKHSTYYGVGMALCRIIRAVFDDEHSVLTLSTRAGGAYGLAEDDLLGLPCLIGREGIERPLRLKLWGEEIEQLKKSAAALNDARSSLSL